MIEYHLTTAELGEDAGVPRGKSTRCGLRIVAGRAAVTGEIRAAYVRFANEEVAERKVTPAMVNCDACILLAFQEKVEE